MPQIPIKYQPVLGPILRAVLNEALALATTDGGQFTGTVILQTDYKSEKLLTYTMPLIIIALEDGLDMMQWLGGATKLDFAFGMNTYNFDPNSYQDDQTGDSEELITPLDIVRQHFSIRQWIVPSRGLRTDIPMAMADIEAKYGFRFTLEGMHRAKKLDQDGLVLGYRLIFDSIGIDDSTDSVVSSDPVVLEQVNQVGSTILSLGPYPQIINAPLIMPDTQTDIPGNTLIDNIAFFPTAGSPTIRVGTSPGDDSIMEDTVIDGFRKVSVEYYAAEDTTIYFTMAGDGLVTTRLNVFRNYFEPL